MAPNLEIREVTHGSKEYEATVSLRLRILRTPLGLNFTAKELENERGSYHLGAFLDGALAGCLVLKPLAESIPPGRVVQMRQVAVASAHQRCGIGQALVRYSEKFARTKGFSEMILHARETAQPFYERLAYKTRGERFIEVTIPHWEMFKELD